MTSQSTRERRFRLGLASLSILAAVAVFVVAVTVFPHHSSNHDEGVYLQQAQLLLDGQFWMTAPVPSAVQPWFFVQDGARLYPKYTPVTAAVFAPGVALGVPRLVLALVAAGSTALVGQITRAAFDRTTGLVGAGLLVASPLFLVDSALFLSYAPTTLFNLLFVFGYVRACRADDRTRRRRYAVLAGAAVGTAFFARPFTAVLVASPFVGHSLLTVGASYRAGAPRSLRSLLARPAVERSALVAGCGLAFVGLALWYNRVVTGSALVFPYQAFAPMDGPGFGYRRILSYDRVYTPALALRANGLVLWRFATRWTAAAPLGALAAALGLATFLARVRDRATLPAPTGLTDDGLRALLAGVALAVVVGNVFFWGNLNILAALDDPTDGLISLVGPFYHFDLLLPLSAFGASGLVTAWRVLRERSHARLSGPAARALLAALLLTTAAGGAVAESDAVVTPLERSQPYTERYERAYAPFEDRTFENAVLFVPTPYGDWLNHPFQSLRNDPDFDGPVVYAQDSNATERFAVLDAYEGRQPHRYVVRGEWTPGVSEREDVDAAVRPLDVRSASRFRAATTVGIVDNAQSATVRLAGPGGALQYGVTDLSGDTLTVDWVIEPGRVRAAGDGLERYSDSRWTTFRRASTVSLSVTFTQPGGSTVTYRQDLSVETRGDSVRVVWPPRTYVCPLVPDCGMSGAYVRGVDEYVGGVSVSQNLTAAPRARDG